MDPVVHVLWKASESLVVVSAREQKHSIPQ